MTLTDEQWGRILALIPRLYQSRASAIIAGTYLSDEQALTATAIYPQFTAGLPVKVGERYRDGNELYKVIQAHTTQADWKPSAVPALFVKVSLDEWPAWVQPSGAHDAYQIGDKVTFSGAKYTSKIKDNVWPPAAYPAGWMLVI